MGSLDAVAIVSREGFSRIDGFSGTDGATVVEVGFEIEEVEIEVGGFRLRFVV